MFVREEHYLLNRRTSILKHTRSPKTEPRGVDPENPPNLQQSRGDSGGISWQSGWDSGLILAEIHQYDGSMRQCAGSPLHQQEKSAYETTNSGSLVRIGSASPHMELFDEVASGSG